MDEIFYALIKLTTGEEIISQIFVDNEEDDPIIALGSPVIIQIASRGNNNVLKFEPWMKVAQDETLFIRLSKVITMTELSGDNYYVQCYQEYVDGDFQDINTGSKGVKLSRTMGSLGTVDEARDMLEKCLSLELDT
jgi:hypothetical protein